MIFTARLGMVKSRPGNILLGQEPWGFAPPGPVTGMLSEHFGWRGYEWEVKV